MAIRGIARRFERELQCHRNVANAYVTHNVIMRQAVNQALSRDKRRSLMQWLTRHGPFWEDIREHRGDDWLEYGGEIVTDSAVGEAAYCLLHGIDRALVSVNPSSWLISPLTVDWRETGPVRSVDVPNYWDADDLEQALADAPVPLQSWEDLETTAQRRYPDLTFSTDSFEPLHGHPFGKGPAERLLLRLAVLNDLRNCFDERGNRTPRGDWLDREYFTGRKAWFSDSSPSEKVKFKTDLTFPHPTNAGESLFCTWHGKVKTPQLRIHFSWPIRVNEPLYVVHVGPKITKR